ARVFSFALAPVARWLSAGAVSHRISRLERAPGPRLFLRLTRSLRLSEDGARIYQAWLAGQAQLEAALNPQEEAEPAGAVALYARPSLAQCWLAPRLADFAARHPRIALDIRSGNEMVDFRSWNIDLALYYSAGEFPVLDAQRLMDEQVAPVCSPEYADRHGL
ncbi:DNA-binding transcriptional regulator DsdC, partial [Pseudomonas sp. MWU13-2860]